jgi:oligoribonuclease
MHTRSGLLDKIRTSTITLADAEKQTVEFIRAHVEIGTAPLAGNSVWKDKQFLEEYMPAVMGELHYRIIDVSTVKELTRRWYPGVAAPRKNEVHRAMDDIRESLAELKFYRANVFR